MKIRSRIDLARGAIYPPLRAMRKIPMAIAVAVATKAYALRADEGDSDDSEDEAFASAGCCLFVSDSSGMCLAAPAQS